MSCVGVPLSVSKNIIIPENTVKHNFTIYGLFQNISVWQGLHDRGSGGLNPGTTYIKNGKYIYRQVRIAKSTGLERNQRHWLRPFIEAYVWNERWAHLQVRAARRVGKPGRMGDGTELIFRVTLGMTLKPGDNITLMLPYFSNSPNPYNCDQRSTSTGGSGMRSLSTILVRGAVGAVRALQQDKTTTTICSTCSISRRTRVPRLSTEGYTPIGGGDLVNSHGDGEFNFAAS